MIEKKQGELAMAKEKKSLDEEDKYYDPYQMYQDGKAEALAVLENSYLYHKVPLNDR